MHQDAMKLRRVRKAIPVHLLHLSRFVGIEEEVAACRAPRERQGGTGIHDAGSGHAFDRSERRAEWGSRDLRSLEAQAWRFTQWPPAGVTSGNHSTIRS